MRKTNEKGITLIALIITIIVLLILAGISINGIIGNKGIIKKTLNAKELTEISQEKENIELAVVEASRKKGGNDVLQEKLDKYFGEGNTEIHVDDKNIVIKFTDSDRVYKVDNDGNVTKESLDIFKTDDTPGEFEGTGDENDPYIIMSIEDLVYLSQDTNNGNSYEDKYFELGRDLSFTSEFSYNNPETREYNEYLGVTEDIGLMEALTNRNYEGFIPIGIVKATMFSGTFDGANYTISNIYINRQANQFIGIFGNSHTIKNLTVKDGYIIAGTGPTGGIVGASRSGTIENCHNKNTNIKVLFTTSLTRCGGIVGQSESEKIDNCTNTCEIKDNLAEQNASAQEIMGGICALCLKGEVINCTSYGNMEMYVGVQAGGICGQLGKTGKITNCTNYGDILIYCSARAGGMTSSAFAPSVISGCVNYGNIGGYAAQGIAGIVGFIPTNDYEGTIQVIDCYNEGDMTGCIRVGGIVGMAAKANTLIEKCFNKGVITGTYEYDGMGGIVGQLGRGSKVINCYNTNTVTGINAVGGIVGISYYEVGEVTNCYNIGKVSGTSRYGGIIGDNQNSTVITNSYCLTGVVSGIDGSILESEYSKDDNFIKNDFLTAANSTEEIWKIDADKNDGYPILK